MSHQQDTRTDHRHAETADEHADKTASDSLHGSRDIGTGGDSAKGGGRESAKAGAENLDPPGDPDEPTRAEWEKIAKNQRLWTNDDELPSPHLPE
jgi:hypothetical protein